MGWSYPTVKRPRKRASLISKPLVMKIVFYSVKPRLLYLFSR